MISELKKKQLLAAQTSMANKVFGVVPMLESWNVSMIVRELLRKQITCEHKAVMGCLDTLVRVGLVIEKSGLFKQAPVRKYTPKPIEPELIDIDMDKPMKTEPVATNTSLDKLADISFQLKALGEKLILAGKQIEDIAVEIEEDIQSNGEDTTKLKQLQSTIKQLMEGVS